VDDDHALTLIRAVYGQGRAPGARLGGGSSGRHLPRWGTLRLRMTQWNVAVLAVILGALGGVAL